MQGYLWPSASESYSNEPAANTAAMIDLGAPGTGKYWVIYGVQWSYDGDPTAGSLTLLSGTSEIFKVDITTGGPGFMNFVRGKRATNDDERMVAVLAAGGAGISGIVNVDAVAIDKDW